LFRAFAPDKWENEVTRLFQEYVQRAQEAEAQAASVQDGLQKKQWLGIANGYRNLAQARLINASTLEHIVASPTPQTSPESSPALEKGASFNANSGTVVKAEITPKAHRK
jgi:hypothetical protein